jgi:hypothetical protein
MAAKARSSLVPIQPTGTKPPFFWIHGDSSAFFLSRYLGPDQPFYTLDHQSQDGRPAVYINVDVIAAYYLREIQKVQANGPYFIGGYSFGGVVAFEPAQQVTQQGEQVRLPALLDPPSLARHDLPSSSVVRVPSESTLSSFAGELRRHMRHLATLTLKERIAYIRARAMYTTAGLLRRPVTERTRYRPIICRYEKNTPPPLGRNIADGLSKAQGGMSPRTSAVSCVEPPNKNK